MTSGKKNKKKKEEAAPRQEVDAVKGFIIVMLVLIAALGVFIVIIHGQLREVEDDGIKRAQTLAPKMSATAEQVRRNLKLIKDSEETTLMKFPERFFGNIYQAEGIAPKQVTLGPKRETTNRKERYTEIYWELDIEGLTREQATRFLHGVEMGSAKAKSIEATLRRSRKKDAGEEEWDGRFKIGYRVAGTRR